MKKYENEPLVSVRLMTYNHAAFIEDAINGILLQKTNFPVEVVVGDDFSTDGTLEIVKQFSDTANIQFKILDRQVGDDYWEKRQKLGRLYNFVNILENCNGKYIALLDGDDYWTDPLKLQKQVDFLEANSEVSVCFHQAQVLKCGKFQLFNEDLTNEQYFGFHDLIERNFISTASCMFRNSNTPYPSWLLKLNAADWGLHLWNAQKGKIAYMSDNMSVYRIHKNGLWGGLDNLEMKKKGIEILRQLDELFNYKYHLCFEASIERRENAIRKIQLEKNKVTKSIFWKLKNSINRKLIQVINALR